MTEAEAKRLLGEELWLCDLVGRRNEPGAAAWRDKAAAIRFLIPDLKPLNPMRPEPTT